MEAKHTPGPWLAFNMIHAERGDRMTPDELGEYVANNDLLVAVEGMVAVYAMNNAEPAELVAAMRHQIAGARAAIAKAGGK